MAIAGVGVAVLIRNYLAANPIEPVSDAARKAGRRWDAEIAEREGERESEE